MRKSSLAFCLVAGLGMAGCNGNAAIPPPTTFALPPPSNSVPVPAGVSAVGGYKVSVFAKIPNTSSKPDSLVQMGGSVFVGTGDDLNPDGTPGPSGKKNVEILQYALDGTLQKTWSILGHNDGLLANGATLWAMSNEDCNPRLTVIDVANGSQRLYKPQSSLVNGAGCLRNTNGGVDDMQIVAGRVYVSASNPNPTPAGPCPLTSSTPGCPNGVSDYNALYILTLNGDGTTFNLSPVLTSGTPALNIATGKVNVLNTTDPDSEGLMPDGKTLLVDSQQDSEVVFLQSPGPGQVVSFLPLTLNGALTAIDDTRWAPSGPTFMLDADTAGNYVYRVDGNFTVGNYFSSAPTQIAALNIGTGVLTPIVSGLGHANGMLFVTPASSGATGSASAKGRSSSSVAIAR